MKLSRRFFLIGALLVLASSMVFAKGDQADSGTPGGKSYLNDPNINLSGTLPIIKDPSKFPKLKVMNVHRSLANYTSSGETIMAQKLMKDTGVQLEWIDIPQDGASEKLNLILASGSDLPDFFWDGITRIMVATYMDQDVLLPTEDLIQKYMPNLRKVFTKYPKYKAAATAPNGHMYGFPYIEELYGLVLTHGPLIINTEWLRKVGKKMPTTVDEFTDVLKAFRDGGDLNGNGKKDEIPYMLSFTNRGGFGTDNSFHQFTGCFGQADAYSANTNADHMRIINGKVVFTAMDTAYRETAKYFNMLNREKLLDPDSFSPDPSSALYQSKVKGSDARVGVMALWNPPGEIPDVNVRAQYAAVPRLTGPRGKSGFVNNFSEMQQTSDGVITTDCKYPEVVAAFIDYCYDPQISVPLNWGAVGYIYEKGADGIYHFRLDANNNIKLVPPYKDFNEMRFNTTIVQSPLAILDEYWDKVADYTWDAAGILKLQRDGGKEELLKEYTAVPTMIFTTEEQNRISRIQPTISDIVMRYTMQWVLDGNADSTWNNYLRELKAAGVDDLVSIVQGAYDRYLKVMPK
jgi:putative aldouronate transport system substrate-binding protein